MNWGFMANVYQVAVGRLVEVRLVSVIRTAEDVDAWFDGCGAAIDTLPPGVLAVVVADWRHCPLLSDEASERARTRLRQGNLRVERSAALAFPDSAITVLQFLRLCRDSGNPNRRLFTDVDPMVGWLGEVLTRAEKQRLADFLREPGSSARAGLRRSA
jgi:hypothetical protein